MNLLVADNDVCFAGVDDCLFGNAVLVAPCLVSAGVVAVGNPAANNDLRFVMGHRLAGIQLFDVGSIRHRGLLQCSVVGLDIRPLLLAVVRRGNTQRLCQHPMACANLYGASLANEFAQIVDQFLRGEAVEALKHSKHRALFACRMLKNACRNNLQPTVGIEHQARNIAYRPGVENCGQKSHGKVWRLADRGGVPARHSLTVSNALAEKLEGHGDAIPTRTNYCNQPGNDFMTKESLKEPTSCVLERTGQIVPFKDLEMGEAYYYMGVFWTRDDFEGGTDLRPRTKYPEAPNQTFGSCTFGASEDTMNVEKVTVRFQ